MRPIREIIGRPNPKALALQQAQLDVADFDFREPVVTEEAMSDPALERANRDWNRVTAVAQRAIASDPSVRAVAARYTTEPLSETLPADAIDELAARSDRVARAARATGATLGSMLQLEPVPDELMVPDLRYAKPLRTPEGVAAKLVRTKLHGAIGGTGYPKRIEQLRAEVQSTPGISKSEKDLVATRYRYARDIKLLGLSAELQDHPISETEARDGLITHRLPSETTMVVTEEAFASVPGLLDPSKWQKRTQLKDRVYAVTIDDKEYILKERKTTRHTDVKEHGHIDGLTSAEEFATARKFAALGTLEKDNMKLRWENPLGYVEMADGYQFTLFDKEEGLVEEGIFELIKTEILNTPEAYRKDFKDVATRARTIFHERDDLISPWHDKLQKVRQPAAPDTLTFEEFATAKAQYMLKKSRQFVKDMTRQQGYNNSDADGFAYRIKRGKSFKDEWVKLEIVGFDFEYYLADPAAADFAGKREFLHEMTASGEREIKTAALYAMQDRDGVLPSDTERENAS